MPYLEYLENVPHDQNALIIVILGGYHNHSERLEHWSKLDHLDHLDQNVRFKNLYHVLQPLSQHMWYFGRIKKFHVRVPLNCHPNINLISVQ